MKSATIYRCFRLLLKSIAAVCLFVAFASHSESLNSSNSLQKQIIKNFPKFETHSVIESNNVAAVVLIMPRAEDDEHDMKIAVFHKNTDQSYQLISSSNSWNVYLLDRVGWSAKIENKSLLLTVGGSTGCCSGFETMYRFRIEERTVRLTGEESKSYGYELSNNDIFYETRTSINYLSGKVIHVRRSGTKKDNPNELGFGGKTKRVEVQFLFQNKHIWELSGFSPEQYSNYQMQIPELCGGINEKMKYKPCEPENS